MNRVVQRLFIPEGIWYELESGKKEFYSKLNKLKEKIYALEIDSINTDDLNMKIETLKKENQELKTLYDKKKESLEKINEANNKLKSIMEEIQIMNNNNSNQ